MDTLRTAVVQVLCCLLAAVGLGAQRYPAVMALERKFSVSDVRKADISLSIKSVDGMPLYKLQCHSAGYRGDEGFDYSGDFECRLTSAGDRDIYSTLLTEDIHQSRDWESRGRFFAADLRGPCADIPQFGATRNFKLRGMSLTLQIRDPKFLKNGELVSLMLTVTVHPDADAQGQIAEVVPIPRVGVPAQCKLDQYFVNLPTSNTAQGQRK